MDAAVEYRPVGAADYGGVRALLSEHGWGERVADEERFRRIVERADRTVVAVVAQGPERGRVVGFARALCDGVSNGYLSMVCVAEGYRGRGIGRGLVKRIVGDDPRVTWVLRAGRGSAPFWAKLEFTPSAIAMERVRQQQGKVRRGTEGSETWSIRGDLRAAASDERTLAGIVQLMMAWNRLATLYRPFEQAITPGFDEAWGASAGRGDRITWFVLVASTLKECVDGFWYMTPGVDAIVERANDDGLRERVRSLRAALNKKDAQGIYRRVLERCRHDVGFHFQHHPLRRHVQKLVGERELACSERGTGGHNVLRYVIADEITADAVFADSSRSSIRVDALAVRDATLLYITVVEELIGRYLIIHGCFRQDKPRESAPSCDPDAD